MAAVLLLTAAPVDAAGTQTVTNVSCNAQGYSFTISGTGYDPNTTLYVWVFDNLYPGPPPAGQGNAVVTDGTGSFSLAFTSGTGQTLPAQVEVTDTALNVLTGPDTVSPVTCGPPPVADLAVTKTTTATNVNVGDTIAYTITVSNIGTGAADHVRVMDTLTGPGTITSTSCNTAPPVCLLGTIAPGASVTETMVVTTNGPGTIQNSATATTTAVETNLSNNTGTAPDVSVFQPPPPPGCSALAEINGQGQFTTVNPAGKKINVNVQVQADCDYNPQTHTYYIHHANAMIQADGSPKLLDAKTDDHHADIVTVTVAGSTATVTGTYNGQPFAATLYDSGPGGHLDSVQIMYGTFTTATLVPRAASVDIRNS